MRANSSSLPSAVALPSSGSGWLVKNANGVEARVVDYGGIILSLMVPDREGRLGDVVLGFDSLDSYLAGHPYFGAIVGRYGNRIANGRFTLDGRDSKLGAHWRGDPQP